MITFLEGKLVEKQPTRVVINVGGVGYELLIPLSTFDRLPAADQPFRILTYYHVREDAHLLFGFMTEPERRMFLLLMTVSGIGPKLALSTLSGLPVRDLKRAVAAGDAKRLSSISGIGKRTSERIIVELRDKISQGEAMEASSEARELAPEDVKTRDALLALISLGYKRAEAQEMIRQVVGGARGSELTVEDIIRKALAR